MRLLLVHPSALMYSIVFAAVIASALNDYTASLAVQSISILVKRPLLSAMTGTAAFGLVIWLNAGTATAARFQNLLLLTAYWCAPGRGRLIPPVMRIALRAADRASRAGAGDRVCLLGSGVRQDGWRLPQRHPAAGPG